MLKHYSGLLVAFLLISGCSPLQAHVMCTQDDIKPASIEVRSKEISTAFLGTVESIECKDMRRADIRFNIEEVYKGPVLKKIVVQTERGGDVYAGGPVPFKMGEQYLVYAAVEESNEIRLDEHLHLIKAPQLYTNPCFGTRPARLAAADIEFLRDIKGSAKEVRTIGKSSNNSATKSPANH